MRRRLLFVFVLLGGPAGALLALYGMTQDRPVPAIAGAGVLVLALLAWWRRATSLRRSAEEIRRHPFGPRRTPED